MWQKMIRDEFHLKKNHNLSILIIFRALNFWNKYFNLELYEQTKIDKKFLQNLKNNKSKKQKKKTKKKKNLLRVKLY